MKVEAYWHRVCGLQVQENGQLAAVWLGWDKGRDLVFLYDCHLHRRDLLVVQSASIKARGKWIPVAWPAGLEEITDRLGRDYGVNMIPEGLKDSEAMAETVSLELEERMRTGRFKVSPGAALAPWVEEYSTFQRQGEKVPRDSHPLMAATRHAIARLDWARRDPASLGHRKLAPKLSTV